MSHVDSFQMSDLEMNLCRFELALGDTVGKLETIQFGLVSLNVGVEKPNFIILFLEV